jgi:dTDP-4-dehydrorhamnose reductase
VKVLLVTGAEGQVGREVALRALRHGWETVALGRTDLDITDPVAIHRIVAGLQPTVIVNAAAYTAVDRAETELEAAYAVNRDGAAHLAHAADRNGAAIIHLSTDYVFDGAKGEPYVESDLIAPLGVYGRSKAKGEDAVRAAADRHLILRTSWIYAARGRNFLRTMLRLAANSDVLRVVDDQWGSPTAAGDLADVIVRLADKVQQGTMPADGYGTFHAAGAGATTWCGFARTIFQHATYPEGRRLEIRPIGTTEYPTPARRPANSVLDCGRLARVHGLSLRPWPEALAEVMDQVAGQPA